MHYKDETLDFVQHAEGRYMFGTAKFQYDLKDHLGNVRVTVEGKTDQPAPITTSYSMGSSESPSFPTNPNAYFVTSPKYEGSHALKVRGSGGSSSLPAEVSVSKGQEISVSVMAYAAYNHAKVSILFRDGSTNRQQTLEDFTKSLPTASWATMTSSTLTVPSDGTIEIRLIKPSSYSDVYYDKLTIKVQGDLLAAEDITVVQSDDYYPFGMAFNSVTTSGDENLYKYNGKEEQKETGWYDYGARMYMADLGRWGVVDKLADDIMQIDKTPYQYAWNSPVNLTDPDGNCPWCVGALVGFAVEVGSQMAVNAATGKDVTDIDWVDVGAATVVGAATAGIGALATAGKVSATVAKVATTAVVTTGEAVQAGADAKVENGKLVD